MTIDPACPVQSLHVAVSDGVRLAVDVWLPVERIARGEPVGTAFRATRYHRAEQPPGPEPEADSNHAAGQLCDPRRIRPGRRRRPRHRRVVRLRTMEPALVRSPTTAS